VAHALTPDLRGLVLGGRSEPDAASLEAARAVEIAADQSFCGPEPAAVRTAALLGLTPSVVPALRDRDYGDWSGRSLEDLLAAEPDPVAAWLENPHTATPGGETAAELMTRIGGWLAALPDSETRRLTVVAVVHPTVVRAAILHVLDAPPAALRRLTIRPLAVAQFTGHATSWSLTVRQP
jgi:broad specificity phosphatase PhoE